MNTLKSKVIPPNVPQSNTPEAIKSGFRSNGPNQLQQATILSLIILFAGCNCDTYWLDSFEGGRCEEEENEGETTSHEPEVEPTQMKEINIPELVTIQNIGHACSELDDHPISKDFFSQEFKENCETETRCESGRDNCDTFTCEVQENTFQICLTDKSEFINISTNDGSYFNISCSISSITQAPYCQLRMGEDLELNHEYSYQCESGYQATLEARHIRFFTKNIESNNTVCDEISGTCHTTTQYLRISSNLPDDLNDSCPSTNYGHCHAQYVTVTLDEQANGERTFCLQATINE